MSTTFLNTKTLIAFRLNFAIKCLKRNTGLIAVDAWRLQLPQLLPHALCIYIIISITFSGEEEHEAIKRIQTQSLFLVLLSIITPLVLAFETVFVSDTEEFTIWHNKTAGINSSLFGQGHALYALLEILPLCTAIQKMTRTAEFVAFNNVLR